MHEPGLLWVRLDKRQRGVVVKDTRQHQLLFSEREGHVRRMRIGPYMLRYLPGFQALE